MNTKFSTEGASQSARYFMLFDALFEKNCFATVLNWTKFNLLFQFKIYYKWHIIVIYAVMLDLTINK